MAELGCWQPVHQVIPRDRDAVERRLREKSVPDVECLRHSIEGESDQRLVRRRPVLCMLQRPLEKLTADAVALTVGRDEELRKKPQVAADPTESEANNLIRLFR